jgi:sugar diacid utilization regulator
MAGSAIRIVDALPATGELRHAQSKSGYALLLDMCRELEAVDGQLDDVIGLIVDKAVEILDCDAAWLALADEPHAGATIIANHRPGATDAVTQPLGGVPVGVEQLKDAPAELQSEVLGLGVSSVLTAPVRIHGETAGILIAGLRGPKTFGSADVALLTTLAEHGSIAIQNARLIRELATQTEVLERSFDIHRQLTSNGLRGVDAAGIVATLERLLGRQIVVDLESAFSISELRPTDQTDTTAPVSLVPAGRAAVIVGDESVGEIRAYGETLSELELRALEHAATVLVAELLRRRGTWEAEWRLQGELLEELVDTTGPTPESLGLRAQRSGVDLSRSRRVVVIDVVRGDIDDRRLLSTLQAWARRGHTPDAHRPLAFRRGVRIVAAVPDEVPHPCTSLDEELERQIADTGASARVGISRAQGELRRAFLEAEACAQLAMESVGVSIVDAGELAPFGCLFDTADHANAEALVTQYLGRLARSDRDSRVPLLETVSAFVMSGGHASGAAARCFVHVTTLKYRLGLAAQHLHGPIDDPDVRFELRVAVTVLGILESLGRDPLGRRAGDWPRPEPA